MSVLRFLFMALSLTCRGRMTSAQIRRTFWNQNCTILLAWSPILSSKLMTECVCTLSGRFPTMKQPHVNHDNDYLATLKEAAVTGTGQRLQAVNNKTMSTSPLLKRRRLPVQDSGSKPCRVQQYFPFRHSPEDRACFSLETDSKNFSREYENTCSM